MAELTTLARPYAKAAFEYAKENNTINEWENFLLVAGNVVSDEAFADLLTNPAISSEQKIQILMDVCGISPVNSPIKQVLGSMQLPEHLKIDSLLGRIAPQSEKALINFATQLAENDRLALFPEIYRHYTLYKSQELRQVDAYITSAYPLTDEQRQALQKSLAQSRQAIVILHEAVDASLLGGATIKIGDKFTDGSVRGKLQQLKTQLNA